VKDAAQSGGGFGEVAERGKPIDTAVVEPLSATTIGGLFSRDFLKAVRPLYNMHMGCENMGPMLYSLVSLPQCVGNWAIGRAHLLSCPTVHTACVTGGRQIV
jgi:hypothetical protein